MKTIVWFTLVIGVTACSSSPSGAPVAPDGAASSADAGRTETDAGTGKRDAHVEAPCLVAASTPVARVARLLAEQHVGAAIVTKHDKLVGIFTVTDACRALAAVLGDHEEEPDDAA